WVIGFHRPEGGEEALVLAFAAGNQDLIVVDSGADGAARRRHARARRPQTGCRIVHLHQINVVAGAGDEGCADAAADHIDLVADPDSHMVIAGEQQRAHGFPAVRGGVVFLDGRHHVVRARRVYAVLVHAGKRVGAAGDVDLAVGDAGGGSAALRR